MRGNASTVICALGKSSETHKTLFVSLGLCLIEVYSSCCFCGKAIVLCNLYNLKYHLSLYFRVNLSLRKKQECPKFKDDVIIGYS